MTPMKILLKISFIISIGIIGTQLPIFAEELVPQLAPGYSGGTQYRGRNSGNYYEDSTTQYGNPYGGGAIQDKYGKVYYCDSLGRCQ